jgi:hypothetical protein
MPELIDYERAAKHLRFDCTVGVHVIENGAAEMLQRSEPATLDAAFAPITMNIVKSRSVG